MRLRLTFSLVLALSFFVLAPAQAIHYDIIIKNGTVYDGTGRSPRRADVAIKGDKVVVVGNLQTAKAMSVVDANELAVAPGFINMLSSAVEDLIIDGRSLGGIKQGVTTEIFGGAIRWDRSTMKANTRAQSRGGHCRGREERWEEGERGRSGDKEEEIKC